MAVLPIGINREGHVVSSRLDLDGYYRLGELRREFDEWLRGEGLNGPLHITEMTMIGPRRARVVVPILAVIRGEIPHVTIVVNLTSDPPAGTLEWRDAS